MWSRVFGVGMPIAPMIGRKQKHQTVVHIPLEH
jgi:hypothetical protein